MSKKNDIDISKVINETRISGFQIKVLALCCLVSMLDGFDTQSIAFVAPVLRQTLVIDPSTLGFIFSAALLGAALGGISLGIFADKYGRKVPTLVSVAIFGTMTIACGTADSTTELIIYRFIAGIGLGGAFPNIIAIVSEYSPDRTRSTFVVLAIWGFPIGAIVGGMFSGYLINEFGWQMVFYVGGGLSILSIVLLVFEMPESIRYLPTVKDSGERIAGILNKIVPHNKYSVSDNFFISEAPNVKQHYGAIFNKEYIARTVTFSIVYFMSLLLSYLLVNWIPSLLSQSGLAIEEAVMGAVVFNFAGIVGSLVFSRIIDYRGYPITTLVICYLLGAVAVFFLGQVEISFWPIILSIAVTGFFLIGAQMTFPAVVSEYYPVHMRSTGIGNIQSMGKLGSLIGPVVGGLLLSAGFSPSQLFGVGVLPVLVCVISLLVFSTIDPIRKYLYENQTKE
jgi:AAHS family 4-hydroxybenzoate transporter-like MFS transporter